MRFWFKVINLKRGHGKLQAFHSTGGSFIFQQQGMKKKFANILVNQLRMRYPQFAHLSDVELRQEVDKFLQEK